LVAKYNKASEEVDPADFKAKKDIKGKPHSSTEAFENWVDNTINPKESQPDPDAEKADAARGMWASSKEIQAQYKTWQDFLNSEEFDDYLDDEFKGQLESMPVPEPDEEHAKMQYDSSPDLQKMYRTWQEYMHSEDFEAYMDKMRSKAFDGEEVTFEDIKPYVSMYKGDDGKTVHDVLDKDENSVYKTDNAKDAMNYLSKNFSKLRGDTPKVGDFVKKESIKESKTKIVAAIKAKADENAQNIAGVEAELERITQLVNYQ
jgi:hypothetical protein